MTPGIHSALHSDLENIPAPFFNAFLLQSERERKRENTWIRACSPNLLSVYPFDPVFPILLWHCSFQRAEQFKSCQTKEAQRHSTYLRKWAFQLCICHAFQEFWPISLCLRVCIGKHSQVWDKVLDMLVAFEIGCCAGGGHCKNLALSLPACLPAYLATIFESAIQIRPFLILCGCTVEALCCCCCNIIPRFFPPTWPLICPCGPR